MKFADFKPSWILTAVIILTATQAVRAMVPPLYSSTLINNARDRWVLRIADSILVSGGVNFYKTDPLIELDGKAPNPVAVLSNKYDYYIIPPKTTLYMVVTPASEGSTQGNIDLTLVFQKTGAKPGDPEYQLAIYQTWQSSLRRFSDPDFEETPGGAKVVVNPDAYQGAGVRSPNVVTGPGNGSGTFITIEP